MRVNAWVSNQLFCTVTSPEESALTLVAGSLTDICYVTKEKKHFVRGVNLVYELLNIIRKIDLVPFA